MMSVASVGMVWEKQPKELLRVNTELTAVLYITSHGRSSIAVSVRLASVKNFQDLYVLTRKNSPLTEA